MIIFCLGDEDFCGATDFGSNTDADADVAGMGCSTAEAEMSGLGGVASCSLDCANCASGNASVLTGPGLASSGVRTFVPACRLIMPQTPSSATAATIPKAQGINRPGRARMRRSSGGGDRQPDRE